VLLEQVACIVLGMTDDMDLSTFPELDVCLTVHHQYNDVSNQQDATTFSFINLFKSALQVSDDKFAHPQEHFLTVCTALVQCTVMINYN